MFFKKNKEIETDESSEYKRGYNDGYQHGLSKTDSNIFTFNNNINYIRGYEYGFRVGTQQSKMNEIRSKQNNLNSKDSLNNFNSFDKINKQNELNKKQIENPNTFNNFYNNRF